jgi:hypothetical protein
MQSSNVIRAPRNHRRSKTTQRALDLLLQKLWLPRIIYELLPFLYLVLGIAALASAMHMRDWTWILPYAILLGLICLHVCLALVTLRYRYRYRHRKTSPNASGRPVAE